MTLLAPDFVPAVRVDTVDAGCDIYLNGSDKTLAMLTCSFFQRQGHVCIQLADGAAYELALAGQGACSMSISPANQPIASAA